jgi:hypothetical protein
MLPFCLKSLNTLSLHSKQRWAGLPDDYYIDNDATKGYYQQNIPVIIMECHRFPCLYGNATSLFEMYTGMPTVRTVPEMSQYHEK